MYKSAVPDPTSCFWCPHVVPKTFPHTRGRWKIFPGLHGDIWMPSPVFTKFAVPGMFYEETDELPNNPRPTQPKKKVKSCIWGPLFPPTANNFSWVRIGFTEYLVHIRKQTTRNLTQLNSPQTPYIPDNGGTKIYVPFHTKCKTVLTQFAGTY